MEGVGYFQTLIECVDENNLERTGQCLITAARKPSNVSNCEELLAFGASLYAHFGDYCRALEILLLHFNKESIDDLFKKCTDVIMKKQMCYVVARHGITLRLDDSVVGDGERQELQGILDNSKMNEYYLTLVSSAVKEPESPDEICKASLTHFDAVRLDLSSTFVNALVNTGFGQGKLLPGEIGGVPEKWLCKLNEDERISVVASNGMLFLWNWKNALTHLESYLKSNDENDVAGALLGIGIASCNVKHSENHAFTILGKYIDEGDSSSLSRIGAVKGVGLAFVGSRDQNAGKKLSDLLQDASTEDLIGFAAVSLALIYVGSRDEKVAHKIIPPLMLKKKSNPFLKFIPLAIGILFLGKMGTVDNFLDSLDDEVRVYCHDLPVICAFAGHNIDPKARGVLFEMAKQKGKNYSGQGIAVFGIAITALADEATVYEALQALENLLEVGGQETQVAVPLAFALLFISKPETKVIDILGRIAHDADSEVAMVAVISLGLVGAGTKNGRIVEMLGDLAKHYEEHKSLPFCVRIAQGVVHLGQDLLTLSPFHSGNFLLSPNALAGLIIILNSCLFLPLEETIMGAYNFILYYLVLAIQPKILITVGEDLVSQFIPVRLGHVEDTSSTPLVLAAGDQVAIATDEYIPQRKVLEGVVVLRKKRN